MMLARPSTVTHLTPRFYLAATLTLFGPIAACASPVETPSAWAERVAAGHDPRSAFDMLAARDSTGMATAMTAWRDALRGRTSEEVAAMDLYTFVARYQPLWTQDRLNPGALSKLTTRAKWLNPEMLKGWKTSFEKVQGAGVSELWTVGFVVALDPVFTEAGMNAEASAAFRARLERIPVDATARLAGVLKEGKAVAAIVIAETDAMFARDVFQPPYFDEAVTALQVRRKAALTP